MSNWTHSSCEVCWIAQEGTWEYDEVLDAEVLVSVRRPVRISYPPDETPPVEQCCFCGAPTIVGIFVRRDPNIPQFCAPD